MAALFIDPSRLSQGSLLGVSSSDAHTYSGTYRRTDSSHPTQVSLYVACCADMLASLQCSASYIHSHLQTYAQMNPRPGTVYVLLVCLCCRCCVGVRCQSWLQVALKTLVLPSQAGMAAFEERVQTLCQASADSYHMCRIYGVSCLNQQACLVMKLYHHTLAEEMSTSG